MTISRSEVEKVANLARLAFGSDEIDAFTSQLNLILEYVRQIDELDTSGVEPTFHALDLENVLRDDVVRMSLGQAEALANAPKAENDAFVVPKII
ncbi:MAG: Asp-tRNA(Asn)/Glu-tRNA(Gln) amidotransferase subunit GatC [Deltaproteobacteria bacterium]